MKRSMTCTCVSTKIIHATIPLYTSFLVLGPQKIKKTHCRLHLSEGWDQTHWKQQQYQLTFTSHSNKQNFTNRKLSRFTFILCLLNCIKYTRFMWHTMAVNHLTMMEWRNKPTIWQLGIYSLKQSLASVVEYIETLSVTEHLPGPVDR